MDDDDESLWLAIQLHREDLELWEARQGKRRADASTEDCDLILATRREELDALESQLSDRALGRSIANAVEEDATAREIQTITAAEQQAEQDRRYALRLSVNPDARRTPPETTQPHEQPALDDETIKGLQDLNTNTRGSNFPNPVPDHRHSYEEELPHAESSTWAATRRHKNTAQCASCLEYLPVRKLTQEACSHHYCVQCLNDLAQASLQHPTLFPPRCCGQAIPFDHRWFSPLLGRQLRAKKVELGTSDRKYCHRPHCDTFIPPQSINHEIGTCPRCTWKTCVLCKGQAHSGVCPKDPGSQEVLRIAEAEGWQRCRSCKQVIDLEDGCNHITCLCGHEFCYVCGLQWKTCKCPQWEQGRLLARTNALMERPFEAHFDAQNDHRARQAQVQQAQHLVQYRNHNHECRHRKWDNLNGRHQCEQCRATLPLFVFECRQCFFRVCARCRYIVVEA